MDSEVNPQVLAIIEEERLSGPRLSPADVLTKMSVPDAKAKPFDTAWLAAGDTVVAAIWGEYINVAANGRWFCVESLNPDVRADGSDRSASQVQRATLRLTLLKRSFDAGQGFKAAMQTNRAAIIEAESSKFAKISTRVRDDQEWHVASWSPELQLAVLVRGARDWQPSVDEIKTARRPNAPAAHATGAGTDAQGAGAEGIDVDAAAKAYVLRHFSSYGYLPEDVSSAQLGYDVEVKDKKGTVLLRACVRGVSVGTPVRPLGAQEEAGAAGEKLWKLIVVADPLTGAAQHRIYKSTEIDQALPRSA